MHHLSAVKYGMQSFLPAVAKGQLILKCPFGVFKSSKKTNEFFPLKRGQVKKIRALYTTNWRILF